MALSFPTSPAAGDQYIAPNGVTYTWNATLGIWASSGISGAGGGGGGSGVTSVTASAPIASSGGATPVISIAAATTGAQGSVQLAGAVASAAGTSATLVSTPAFSVPKDAAGMTGSAHIPAGTTGQQPSAAAYAGQLRYNTSTPALEYSNGAAWRNPWVLASSSNYIIWGTPGGQRVMQCWGYEIPPSAAAITVTYPFAYSSVPSVTLGAVNNTAGLIPIGLVGTYGTPTASSFQASYAAVGPGQPVTYDSVQFSWSAIGILP